MADSEFFEKCCYFNSKSGLGGITNPNESIGTLFVLLAFLYRPILSDYCPTLYFYQETRYDKTGSTFVLECGSSESICNLCKLIAFQEGDLELPHQ